MEIWFYHLQSQPLERALPSLVEKGLQRGWRIVVQTCDERRLKALDDLLWTANPESFLPHGTMRDANATFQPILLTTEPGNPNGAAMRMYVDGADIALAPESADYERVILLFDGRDDVEVAAARRQWSRLKAQGFTLAYWQQADSGRWDRKM